MSDRQGARVLSTLRRPPDGRAGQLVDHVFPEVPVRQWVLSLPHRVRYLLAWNRDLFRPLSGVAVRTVLGFFRRRARRDGVADGHSGAVVIVQRLGRTARRGRRYMARSTIVAFCPKRSRRPRSSYWRALTGCRSCARPSRQAQSLRPRARHDTATRRFIRVKPPVKPPACQPGGGADAPKSCRAIIGPVVPATKTSTRKTAGMATDSNPHRA
jgi:hypothetical protein